jgi:hypothetical protein
VEDADGAGAESGTAADDHLKAKVRNENATLKHVKEYVIYLAEFVCLVVHDHTFCIILRDLLLTT